MKFLYVPWRSKYVKDSREKKYEECIFCSNINENNDEKHFILARYKHNFVMLNLYPYNTGHLLIIPFKHAKDLNEMEQEARAELIELTSQSNIILKEHMNAEGINIGMNLGKAAGAGIPQHLHLHVIPRWTGDTNFMPIIAETKTISIDLKKLYNDLKSHFSAIKFKF